MANVKQALEILRSATAYNLTAGTAVNDRIVVHLVGKPGVGKTSLGIQVAGELDADHVITNVADRDPAEIAGLPWEANGTMVRLRPDWFPEAGAVNPTTGKPFEETGIVIFDELAQGSAAAQNAMRPATTEHRVGERRLPPTWSVMACSNDQASRANTTRIGSHVNSSTLTVEVEPDAAGWLTWAATKGISPVVQAYITNSPQSLLMFDADAKAFPSPRAWERASHLMTALQQASSGARLIALSGTLGEGEAARFLAFAKLADRIVTPHAIFADPTGVTVPVERDVMTFTVINLASSVAAKESKAFFTYLDRLPPDAKDLTAYAVTSAFARDPKIKGAPGAAAWLAANSWLVV